MKIARNIRRAFSITAVSQINVVVVVVSSRRPDFGSDDHLPEMPQVRKTLVEIGPVKKRMMATSFQLWPVLLFHYCPVSHASKELIGL